MKLFLSARQFLESHVAIRVENQLKTRLRGLRLRRKREWWGNTIAVPSWEEFHFCDQCHCINSVLIYTYKIYLFDRLQSKHVTHKLNVGVVPGTLELTWTINLMHKRYQTATENSRILSINVGYVQARRLRRCCNIPFLQIQFWISHLYPFSPKIPGSVTADTAAMSPSFSAKWNVLLLPQTIIKIQEHFLYC